MLNLRSRVISVCKTIKFIRALDHADLNPNNILINRAGDIFRKNKTQRRVSWGKNGSGGEPQVAQRRTFLPGDAGDREARDGTLDDGRLAGHSSVVSHRSHMRQPVNIEPSSVMRLRDAIHRWAPVLAAVLHPHGAYVHVGYHVAVHRHVLAYHESASKSISLA